MDFCIRLKAGQHRQIRNDLIATGDALIVEDVTSRANRGSAMFWDARKAGTNLTNIEWHGENTLGKLWMRLRGDLNAEMVLKPILEEIRSEGYRVNEHGIIGTSCSGSISVSITGIDGRHEKTFDADKEKDQIKDWIKNLCSFA